VFDNGLLATGIGFPTVPEGKARIRTIVTATHTLYMLDRAAGILTSVAKRWHSHDAGRDRTPPAPVSEASELRSSPNP